MRSAPSAACVVPRCCLSCRAQTAVERFAQSDAGVDVTFNDGSQATFDLVIGADGIHSQTRAQLLEKSEYEMFDSGWGTWVVWTKQPLAPAGTVREFWGVGNFLGIYPVKDELMICLGGPKRIALDQTLGSPADRARKLFSAMDPAIAEPVLSELRNTANPFFWDLHDYRSKAWYRGRVVLVGDAAAGFLPTAGIGASMAMNGAASLADELGRTDAKYLGSALKAYEQRQKARTEKAQSISRELGKFMLVDSKPLGWLRDEFSKVYTVHQFAHDTMALMEAEIS
jgi:2-polyprenyl-6-methoxyphenol hydroxylase-like FAD-dependent oxidoreductase